MRTRRVGVADDLEGDLLSAGVDGAPGAPLERVRGSWDEIASALVSGAVDVALVPAHRALATLDRHLIVPGLGISSRHRYRGARLMHRGPLAAVRTVRVCGRPAAAGHTAPVLLEAMLRASGADARVVSELVPLAEEDPLDPRPGEALLLVGDAALAPPAVGSGVEEIDLARAWFELTGEWFVWAVWLAWPGAVDTELYRALHRARTRARRDLRHRARARAGDDERAAQWVEAMSDSWVPRLGSRQLRGLAHFAETLVDTGVAEAPPPVSRWPTVDFGGGEACRDLARVLAAAQRGKQI